ncbi:MBL fold metallo-hydrolase [Cohnella ginsengisoli]|uniref:MBL fold metallo-hydrolase n=1 Tax=Cohnella ginsengisoli TaxID=425004 RepID=A0A9X4QPG0_9BACL|nr:MBL fold metallo-hydrolase [Cohnella ginsengisoli]MDG0794299.1 MBL fold metallo-hydrolase [Cohnella ginsengisoli]
MWCSWAIEGGGQKVFFSGDSGYGPHFAEIGERFGPFDLALMECGQYDPRWAAIHMSPEETVQAHVDVRGGTLLPVHWGAFTLALHEWNDPIRRASAEAARRDVRIISPRIGGDRRDRRRERWGDCGMVEVIEPCAQGRLCRACPAQSHLGRFILFY